MLQQTLSPVIYLIIQDRTCTPIFTLTLQISYTGPSFCFLPPSCGCLKESLPLLVDEGFPQCHSASTPCSQGWAGTEKPILVLSPVWHPHPTPHRGCLKAAGDSKGWSCTSPEQGSSRGEISEKLPHEKCQQPSPTHHLCQSFTKQDQSERRNKFKNALKSAWNLCKTHLVLSSHCPFTDWTITKLQCLISSQL